MSVLICVYKLGSNPRVAILVLEISKKMVFLAVIISLHTQLLMYFK